MTSPIDPGSDPLLPGHAVLLFHAEDIFVSHGVNHDEGIGHPETLCPGDVYELDPRAKPLRLVIAGDGGQRVAAGSEVGAPGEAIALEARLTLMSPDGDSVELLVLALAGGMRLALPLSPMGPRIEYTLLQTEAAPDPAPLADLVCVSFARGTMITMGTGEQVPIERLQPGDRVLTRDHGPQPIRWVGRATLRGVGAFAPVVIQAGLLGNSGDLIVSQHHRMFLYQRRRGALPTAEILVQAKHLVDGERVFIREGAVVEYYSLVFDRHEIIYAEGVPAESLMVNEATVTRLPPEFADEIRARFPGLKQSQHFGTEAGREALEVLRGPGRK